MWTQICICWFFILLLLLPTRRDDILSIDILWSQFTILQYFSDFQALLYQSKGTKLAGEDSRIYFAAVQFQSLVSRGGTCNDSYWNFEQPLSVNVDNNDAMPLLCSAISWVWESGVPHYSGDGIITLGNDILVMTSSLRVVKHGKNQWPIERGGMAGEGWIIQEKAEVEEEQNEGGGNRQEKQKGTTPLFPSSCRAEHYWLYYVVVGYRWSWTPWLELSLAAQLYACLLRNK